MVKIYKQPFAHDGDAIAIPDASQPDGKMSSADGWTPDYQLPKTDPNYKPVGRQEMNGVFKEVTEALGQVQVQGAASWSADGAPYPINAQVYHNGKQWLALRANSVEPAEGADWTELVGKQYVDAAFGAFFVKPVRGKPLLEKTSPTSVIVPAGLSSAVDGKLVALDANITLSLATDLVGSTAVAGTDYFVYLKPDATAYISASDAELDGRLIGGFHYGLTGHTETPSGNKTEWDMEQIRGINRYTFWDLNFRCTAKAGNRGRFFYKGAWYDIYLAGENYGLDFYSKPFVFIAAGALDYSRKYPKIPLEFGGDGTTTYGKLTPFQAMDLSNAAGMNLIEYADFTGIAYGVQEGLAQAEPVAGKIGHQPALTSKYGMEQATGVQWIWGRTKGSSTSDSWSSITDGRGQVYSNLTVGLFGAGREGAAGQPGSRTSSWDYGLARSTWRNSLRCRGDHLQLD